MILSVNGKVYWTFQQAHGRPGTTAEVITERLGDDGLLGTGTVRYSEAYIYTDPKFGAIGPQPWAGTPRRWSGTPPGSSCPWRRPGRRRRFPTRRVLTSSAPRSPASGTPRRR